MGARHLGKASVVRPDHRRLMGWVVTCAAVLTGTPAHADISIRHAEYAAGVLVVRGETSQSNQRVTLDGRYDTRTGPDKTFRFRIRYLPRDCTVDIRAGRETKPATVAKCEPAGVSSPMLTGSRQDGGSDPTVGEPFRLHVVRKSCEPDEDCVVACSEREFAINAYCPTGSAKLRNERTVACAERSDRIVAYCAAPQPQAR